MRGAVQRWLDGAYRPGALVNLIAAEQGVAACYRGNGRIPRLHVPTLPRNLRPGDLGAWLLTNELAWEGLQPKPEDGLAGEWFHVRPRATDEEIDP